MKMPLWGFLLLGLAACSGQGRSQSGAMSLRVADAALANGVPAIALQVAHDVIAAHPRSVAAYIRQGDALFDLGRKMEAAQSYSRALELDSDNVQALVGVGRTDLSFSPERAEVPLLRAATLDRQNSVALNDLGIAQDLQGRHKSAQRYYEAALGISPNMTAAQINLGLSLALSGDTIRAVQILQPFAAATDASPRVREDLATALALRGDRLGAARLLQSDMPEGLAQKTLVGLQELASSP